MKMWTDDIQIRSIQTNLRETDWLDMDAERFVSDLKKFHANAVWLNTAGIVANYPTTLPYHYRNPYLKGDPLSQIIDVCHRNNIKIISRNDFSKIRRKIFEQHPDWAYRTGDGEIVDYNGDVHVCFNSDYQQIKALEILQEVTGNYAVDAVFCNAFGFKTTDYSYHYYGICHCDKCKKLFFDMFGIDLPKEESPKDPAYGKYLKFKNACIEQFRGKFYRLVRSVRPEIAITDLDFKRLEVNTEYKKRPLPHWQYDPVYLVKSHRGIESGKRNISASTVDFIGYYYRHIAVTPELQELRLWQAIANLGGIDWYLMGRIDNHLDRSGFAAIGKVFSFAEKNESTLKGFKPRSGVLLVSEGGTGKAEGRGWVRVLLENHIQFDMAIAEQLSRKNIEKYRIVIVPNLPYLEDGQLSSLDEYAENGGIVITTGETAIYDDLLKKREVFGLKCMGIEKIEQIREDMVSSMLLLDDRDKETFKSFSVVDIAYFGETFIFASYKENISKYMKLIPPQCFGPPERCYHTQVTERPGITVNSFGKGKGVHIPWLPGKLYYDEGYSNPANMMKDVLVNLCHAGSEAPDVNPMVEVTVAERERQILVQFVNLTGHFGNSYFAPVPVYDQTVVLPAESPPAGVVSLREENNVISRYENGRLAVTVKELKDYEGILITG
jgi:hypothetical protein